MGDPNSSETPACTHPPLTPSHYLQGREERLMAELVFLAMEAREGGYTARALGASIVTEARI